MSMASVAGWVLRINGASCWPRRFCAVFIVALMALLIPELTTTPRALFAFCANLQPDAQTTFAHWRAERGGEWVLAPRVRAMLALLRDNRIREFRASDAILRDADLSLPQRLAEAAWPIRVSADAQHWLFVAGERPGAQCRIVASNEGAILARCA